VSRAIGSWAGRFETVRTDKRGIRTYVPHATDPLRYTSTDGKTYTLKLLMDTDGATIPRPFGIIPGLSKWDWPEAAILHDALWEARYSGVLRVSFWRSNRLMQEAIVSLGWSRPLASLVFWLVTLTGWWFWISGERGVEE